MRILSSFIAAAALSASACAQAGQSAPAASLDPERAAAVERVEAVVERFAASDYAPPGFSVAVVDADGPLLVRGYGVKDVRTGAPVDARTAFYNASTTKAFTALAAIRLHEQGRFDLSRSFANFAPEVALPEPIDPAAVTVRSLLGHSHHISAEPVTTYSAFIRRPSANEVFQLVDAFATYDEAEFRYQNTGYVIYDAALQRALGVDFRDIVQSEVLDPLGMGETYLRSSEIPAADLAIGHEIGLEGWNTVAPKTDPIMHAAGGMFLSANDMATWLEAQLNEGRIGGEQRIPASAIETSQTAIVAQSRRLGPLSRHSYAWGWNVGEYDGETLFEHGGGFPGARAWATFMPEEDLGVGVLTNVGSGGNMFAVLMYLQIYDALRGVEGASERLDERLAQLEGFLERGWESEREYIAEQRALIAGDFEAEDLAAFTGAYFAPEGGELVVAAGEGGLVGRIGEIRLTFHPTADADRILGDAGPGYRTYLMAWGVEYDDAGRPVALDWDGAVYRRRD
ncbi:hypothetical protein DDZ18_13585 [Marinicauda salina]|uniref:Beta-lactamase-related domain-containing protein n=1 Tax=Marinicauda salina TaxID=2135793 RepID=A0A2U2BR06_9PROT|nr:serine hydrolase domain-containing protein [Marinicauda salina]PWE16444.1 hypothetical protein DDZ18_13585 [Marinicauda salina]